MSALDEEQSKKDDLAPKSELDAIRDDATRDAVLTQVGFGVAVAGAATGLILLFVVEEDEAEPAAAMAPMLGTDTLGLGLTGRFQ